MLNRLRPGFERAIRIAPSAIDSSPGTLTTVNFRVLSFERDRIVRENISCVRGKKNISERQHAFLVTKPTYKVERRFV